MEKILTIDERLKWVRENRSNLRVDDIEKDLQSFYFMHPYYNGMDNWPTEKESKEAKHELLDIFDVPRKL